MSRRPFKDRPTGIWIDETVARIKGNAQPELIESLHRNPIPKDSRFRTLKHLITVDGTKRPEGYSCPCPMCTPNRFLTGSLVWFPDLQFCAFIGNCCANDDVLAEAEKERKWRERRSSEEDDLLAALPWVATKLTILESLKPVALEAVRVYRKFWNSLPRGVHEQLRKMKQHHGGQLTLIEIMRDESNHNDDNYHGPPSFSGRGEGAAQVSTGVPQRAPTRLPELGPLAVWCVALATSQLFRWPSNRFRLHRSPSPAFDSGGPGAKAFISKTF